MPDFNPFDMDLDGNVNSIDFLEFHHLMQRMPQLHEDEEADVGWNADYVDRDHHRDEPGCEDPAFEPQCSDEPQPIEDGTC